MILQRVSVSRVTPLVNFVLSDLIYLVIPVTQNNRTKTKSGLRSQIKYSLVNEKFFTSSFLLDIR